MYRPPAKPQRSPGASRPSGRFPSPAPVRGLPGAWSPYASSSWSWSPGSDRGWSDGSPATFGNRSQGFAGQVRRRGDSFRRPQSFSPTAAPNLQSSPSDAPVEKYFSPSMLEDPWKTLQPVTTADAVAVRRVS